MRVTVVGATGHIGTWLIPRLVRAGHDVVAVSRGLRNPYHDSPEWQSVRMVTVDRAAAETEQSFGSMIAELDSGAVVDLTCFDLQSAEHLVDALRGRVDLFVHCGTLWVHGIPNARPYDETFPRKPFGEYGIKKAAIEQYLIGAAQEGFPATVLHPGHITGPGWLPVNPAGNLDIGVFERLERGDSVTLPDAGAATLQHVHADDVAQAFELAITKPAIAIGESFHVAAPTPITFRDYAHAVASWSNREASLEFQPWDEWRKTVSERDAELTEDHMLHSPCASITKAVRRLGFKPRFSALEAVRDALSSAAFRMFALLICVMTAVACAGSGADVTGPTPVTPSDTAAPPVMREMRGVWIATVANIDWPSSRTLTAAQQQAELVDILTKAKAAGLNTVILQVRPAGDAVYLSSLEPWAKLLTGAQGGNPGYDPLAFAIQEAHSRGMELHAWINPFRAGNTSDTTTMVAPHLFRTRRDLIRIYGSNIWMDPGEPDVQDRSIAVIKDIVTRYDVDAIHADDYFYPYVIIDAGKPVPFPDSATFAKYGGGAALADWRRANIDRFVERMYREVHGIKPVVKVGISPFGIWRPGNPAGINGLDAYASIYADSRKWLQQGWVDYLAPQLYWAIAPPQQSYTALIDWWLGQNTMGRHIWPGLATYKVQDGTSSAFSLTEIPDQIRATRQRTGGTGNLFYNATWTVKKNNLAATLSADLYKDVALVPAVAWLDAVPPDKPAISVASDVLQLTGPTGEPARWWTVRSHATSAWTTKILSAADRSITLPSGSDRVLVQAVDRAGNVSAAAEWRR